MTTQKTLRQSFLLTGLMLGLGASAASAQDVVYREIFPNNSMPNDNQTTASAGWQNWINSGTTTIQQSSTDRGISSVSSGSGSNNGATSLLNGVTGSANATGFAFLSGFTSPMVYFTREYNTLALNDLTSMSMLVSNSTDLATPMNFILEVGAGNWYVSTVNQNHFTSAGAGGFTNGTAVTRTLSLAGSTWNTLNFAPSANISVGLAAILTGPTITGFGIYKTASSGSTRFDNFTITAIPEPSTFAALAGAGVLGLAAFRRRRSAR